MPGNEDRLDRLAAFLADEGVKRAGLELEELRDRVASGELAISNLKDGAGQPYVDLVVEGGGVLGVALVGYTWALEQVGIRFRHVGGASAGAIVAMLLTALGDKEEAKSERLLGALASFELGTLVDGGLPSRLFEWVRRMSDRRRAALGVVAVLLVVVPAILGTLLGPPVGYVALVWLVLSGLFVGWLYVDVKSKRGLNPGHAFTRWISRLLEQAEVGSLPALQARLAASPDGTADPGDGRWAAELRLITAEVCAERKVVLPQEAGEYWAEPDLVDPAEFLRASMAIPFFFQPFHIPGPQRARLGPPADPRLPIPPPMFVDGGTISNFPIAEFHRTDGKEPLAPTFGVRLQSSSERSQQAHPLQPQGLVRFGMALFNTARHALDREFILDNPEYSQLVRFVDTAEHDWLAFHMPQQAQVDLFRRGVEAAVEFLQGFDWPAYLELRRQLDPQRQAFWEQQTRG